MSKIKEERDEAIRLLTKYEEDGDHEWTHMCICCEATPQNKQVFANDNSYYTMERIMIHKPDCEVHNFLEKIKKGGTS